ncbi:DoxX family protein (plasmid) [Rhizobium sp. B230/85]|nr:DoxX family protein [Rhizobium sp. L58/93]MBO9136107.1 DoxX family protein [Rhizobium sp. B209b/85]MBO9171418.1 DoxX family protein [Rhizobium sp. L245/93]MBO9187285.1 DoxX family protein [Rhizobium sp. E27B/91]QXZ87963.1 DoxX family protein [Rhizobium sp. K1/93]QXZ94115.1 DoxX family protein [Rhizobium sp. K15/93]QXZ99235.1 DoxX family protein [Rhizobium sp. B230/85]QYA05347.1 DoxX family protein [Rhizobium sp. B21/90]
MTDDMTLAARPDRTLLGKSRAILRLLDRIPHDAIALLSRLSIAAVFWQSGETKVEGWHVTDNAVYLFETEYKLPFVDPWLAAHLSAFAEHFFPLLLVIGFASRLSALALLGMTMVIEIFVYPDAWPTHGTWAVCFLVIIAGGPGRLSVDHLIARRTGVTI